MGRQSRRRQLRREPVNHKELADLVHWWVCRNTNSYGSGWCLTYALYCTAYLNAVTGKTHAPIGGKCVVPTATFTGEFEHFWTATGSETKPTIIDLATRHNPTLIRNGRPDAVFDAEKVGVKFYVGDGDDVRDHWHYAPEVEPTEFILSEYNRNKAELNSWLVAVGVR